jgi:hypothetical protein
MVLPVMIFLALNAGRDSAAGWGVTMSTDTAFALGLLAPVARGLPHRVRIFPHRGGQDGKGSGEARRAGSSPVRSTTSRLTPLRSNRRPRPAAP